MAGGPYRVTSFDDPLGIGVAGARHINISAVAKCNSAAAPYCMANEVICGGLGRAIGLPIPPYGIVLAPNDKKTKERSWFASLDFNLAGDSLPPIDVDETLSEFPDECAGILLFDIWVVNGDRHAGNLSVDIKSRPSRLNLFDHSHALFGSTATRGEEQLLILRDSLGVSFSSAFSTIASSHCFLETIQTDQHFGKWMDRIAKIPDFMVKDVCTNAAGLGVMQAELDAAYAFLKHRRDNLTSLISSQKAAFKSIRTWSMFL